MTLPSKDLFSNGLTLQQLVMERQFVRRVLFITIAIGLLGCLPFVLNGAVDLNLAGYFYQNEKFIFRKNDLWSFLRSATMVGYGLFYIFIVVGLVISLKRNDAYVMLYPAQWFYLIITSLAGPLVLANLILKTYIGRPRPRNVTEFGGELEFKSLFEAGGHCVDNCSFVSGEVSSMVMIFTSLFFVFPKWRKWFLLMLPFAWLFSAIMRIGQGGHFASDTFLAGIFMIVIAALFYRTIVLTKP